MINRIAPFYLEIAKGVVDAHTHVHVFGHSTSVGTTYEPIWDYATAYTYTTTAVAYYISSSSASDTQDVIVETLDANYNIQQLTVTLAGQTKTRIGTTETVLRVYCAYNDSATDFVGDIYIYEDDTLTAGVPDTATKVRAKITIGHNQTLMSIYTIPAGKTGYLVEKWGGTNKDKETEFHVMARLFGKAFRVKQVDVLYQAQFFHDHVIPVPFLAKTDLEIAAKVSAATAEVTAGFDIILIDD